ncbi:hypothetical protein SCP_1602290 [Sparassis crispa]|uniref:Uncharacterized protein n=1 Tax=Sparassis crispa TaxID=139825 RepID=A0A401H554_9APHY|nr:hypothetical protein SCP_1602290 [Sparassis crispa]GBE89567.1 hypothetical protein SCP_1602290 [Sparassis crispa]
MEVLLYQMPDYSLHGRPPWTLEPDSIVAQQNGTIVTPLRVMCAELTDSKTLKSMQRRTSLFALSGVNASTAPTTLPLDETSVANVKTIVDKQVLDTTHLIDPTVLDEQ